jgi:hypothetical protein
VSGRRVADWRRRGVTPGVEAQCREPLWGEQMIRSVTSSESCRLVIAARKGPRRSRAACVTVKADGRREEPGLQRLRTFRGMGSGTIRRWTQELEKPSPARPLRLGGARRRISGEPREVAGQPEGWRMGPYYRLRARDNRTPPEGRAPATSMLARRGGPANAECG